MVGHVVIAAAVLTSLAALAGLVHLAAAAAGVREDLPPRRNRTGVDRRKSDLVWLEQAKAAGRRLTSDQEEAS
jgi:hypothetical protein